MDSESSIDDIDDVVQDDSAYVGDSSLDRLDGVLTGKIPCDMDIKSIKESRLKDACCRS